MIKFYFRYVDDTLLLVKPANIPHIYNLFKNLIRMDSCKNEESYS